MQKCNSSLQTFAQLLKQYYCMYVSIPKPMVDLLHCFLSPKDITNGIILNHNNSVLLINLYFGGKEGALPLVL